MCLGSLWMVLGGVAWTFLSLLKWHQWCQQRRVLEAMVVALDTVRRQREKEDEA